MIKGHLVLFKKIIFTGLTFIATSTLAIASSLGITSLPSGANNFTHQSSDDILGKTISSLQNNNTVSQDLSAMPENYRSTTIAVLMPADNSPFLPAARFVANGLAAANKLNGSPDKILLIGAKPKSNDFEGQRQALFAQLDAALASGADVVIGPLERNLVAILATQRRLPLPVVALNSIPLLSRSSPSNLIMMSLATENEASTVALHAIRALKATKLDTQAPKVAIITTGSPRENKITSVYQDTLDANNIAFDVLVVNNKNLDELKDQLSPSLSKEDQQHYKTQLAKIRQSAKSNQQFKLLKRSLDAEYRTKLATSEPPYQAALLASDAQLASLIRNRIPIRTRVWATSISNPGDPKTSTSSTTLTYDLSDLVFTESPIVTKYDSASFEKNFQTAMPFSLAAKRLFGLGFDSYALANAWAMHLNTYQKDGETGKLSLNRNQSALVTRIPQLDIIRNGTIEAIDEKFADKPTIPMNLPDQSFSITPAMLDAAVDPNALPPTLTQTHSDYTAHNQVTQSRPFASTPTSTSSSTALDPKEKVIQEFDDNFISNDELKKITVPGYKANSK